LICCVVALNKAAYVDEVARRRGAIIARFEHILESAAGGDAASAIRCLCAGMTMLDTCTFPGDQAQRTALAERFHGRVMAVLGRIEIRPLVTALRLGPADPLPETLGVEVAYDGRPDNSLAVRWTTSDERVACVNGCRSGSSRLMTIRSLPPTQAVVVVTAALDLGDWGYELARRGFLLPKGSFTVRRERATVYCAAHDSFARSLAQALSRRTALDITANRDGALFSLVTELTPESEPVVAGNVYLASARLGVRVIGSGGDVIMNISKKIRGADGRSAAIAVRNTEVLALAEAVRQVEGAF
jgi:hypothetical protein